MKGEGTGTWGQYIRYTKDRHRRLTTTHYPQKRPLWTVTIFFFYVQFKTSSSVFLCFIISKICNLNCKRFFLNSYSVMLTFFCKYGKLYYKFHSGRFHLPASKTKSPTSLPLKSLRGSADTTLPNASNAEGTFWHPYHQCAVGRGNAGFASSTYWA